MKATLNYNQSQIFNAIFNSDMTIKNDCPKRVAHYGGHRTHRYGVGISLAYEDFYKQVEK